MAKRRTHKKRHHGRRRHRGGIHGTGGGIMKVIEYMAAGGAGGWGVMKAMQTFGAGKNPKMVSGLALGGCTLLALKSKNPFVTFAAIGGGTAALMELGKNMGMIRGVGESNEYDVPMSGVGDYNYIEQPVAGVGRNSIEQVVAGNGSDTDNMIITPFGN